MPKLKHLEVQGYKTFATRTEFLFDEGITAIVGPNGSGKSNIADAIRWALGEQSYRSLRGRQTVDMIFHGSEQRARLGMASVVLTLDNATSWLPIEFQEVAVARRAHRSGENEYLLNHTRVRLRDILDLLAETGLGQRTYTVVGQGLVDQALSLRSDERRALFEEAAGISLYKDRRSEAIGKLDETRANLVRVQDIINEITPRLRRLEAEARRAEEYAQLQLDLRRLLGTWHAYRWQRALHDLRLEEKAHKSAQITMDAAANAVSDISTRLSDLQQSQKVLREELGEWHRASGQLHRQAESVQRELAVRHERRRQLGKRVDDLESEIAGLHARLEAQTERVKATKAELAAIEERCQAQAEDVRIAEVGFAAQEAQYADRQSLVRKLQDDVLDLVARIAEDEQRLQQLQAQRGEALEARTENERELAAARAEAQRSSVELDTIAGEIASLQGRINRTEAAHTKQRSLLEANQQKLEQRSQQLGELQASELRLRDRLELLARLDTEAEGYADGVRSLVQSGREGLIGPIGAELRVDARFERAVEAALGSRIQAIIVESWSDAEEAIRWLRRQDAGRATFLPLDSLRPLVPLAPVEQEGIIGIASQLVQVQARLQPALDLLLGRTLVARDLASAQEARRHLGATVPETQIVTLDGDILHGDGRVTGGSSRPSRVLDRTRERSELPDRISQARQEIEAAQQLVRESRQEGGAIRAALESSDLELAKLARELEQVQARQAEARRPLDLARQREAWHRDLLTKGDTQLVTLHNRTEELTETIEELRADLARQQRALAEAQEVLAASDAPARQAELAGLQAHLKLTQSEHDGVQAVLDGQQEVREQLRQQIETKATQRSGLARALAELEGEITALAGEEATLAGGLESLSSQIEPAEETLSEQSKQLTRLEAQERSLQARMREDEMRANRVLLAVERHQDALQALLREIDRDLGPVRLEGVETLTFLQPLLPLTLPAERLPPVHELPQGIEEDIRGLQRQERRMGSVNPNAPADFQEALDRHDFLTEQATDLEQACASLGEVISELDEVMKREFESTFQAVAERFKEYFGRLFAGGSARIELTDPDNPAESGVDIVARPPGKRVQELALLSGGERSLTAIALVFAILSVSPPPFCVLDEVDAMLDEANVGRFRDLLKELSSLTQMIVITHNRQTIEAADTVYGVSMGADSVSQVVSMRLHGEAVAH